MFVSSSKTTKGHFAGGFHRRVTHSLHVAMFFFSQKGHAFSTTGRRRGQGTDGRSCFLMRLALRRIVISQDMYAIIALLCLTWSGFSLKHVALRVISLHALSIFPSTRSATPYRRPSAVPGHLNFLGYSRLSSSNVPGRTFFPNLFQTPGRTFFLKRPGRTFFLFFKRARAHLFPQTCQGETPDFCGGAIGADPVCPQPSRPPAGPGRRRPGLSNCVVSVACHARTLSGLGRRGFIFAPNLQHCACSFMTGRRRRPQKVSICQSTRYLQ